MPTPETPWWHHAACAGTDINIWYADDTPGTQRNPRSKTGTAKTICGRCTVTEACLEDAMRIEGIGIHHSYRTGIRGGLTARERWRLETERRNARGGPIA